MSRSEWTITSVSRWHWTMRCRQQTGDTLTRWPGGGGGAGNYSSLTRSLSLVLDEFYNHLHKVGISAATGDRIDKFWDIVRDAAAKYEDGYLEDLIVKRPQEEIQLINVL